MRHKIIFSTTVMIFLFAASVLFNSCGDDTAPTGLSYSGVSTTHAVGTAISAMYPTASNFTPVSYTIFPSLPSGLSMNSSTGYITGTPTATLTYSSFYVTAQDSSGKTVTATINFGVASSASDVTCNTSGICAGCTASYPYSCNNATMCFSSFTGCRSNNSCNSYLP